MKRVAFTLPKLVPLKVRKGMPKPSRPFRDKRIKRQRMDRWSECL